MLCGWWAEPAIFSLQCLFFPNIPVSSCLISSSKRELSGRSLHRVLRCPHAGCLPLGPKIQDSHGESKNPNWPPTSILFIFFKLEVSEMAQWTKGLAAKSDYLSSIPRTSIMGENRLKQVVWTWTHRHTCVHTQAHRHTDSLALSLSLSSPNLRAQAGSMK